MLKLPTCCLSLLFATLCACSGGTPSTPSSDAGADAPLLDDAGSDLDGGPDTPDAGPPTPRPLIPWEPPFEVDRETGWRGSTGTFCSEWLAYVDAASIVADDDGVRLLVSTGAEVCLGCGDGWDHGTAIVENDGTGWSVRFSSEDLPGNVTGTRMTGFDGGRLWLEGGDCPLSILGVGDTEPACIADPDYPVARIMPFEASRAYGLEYDAVTELQRVIRIDDRVHTSVAEFTTPGYVAADATGILAVRAVGSGGDFEFLRSIDGVIFEPLPGVFSSPVAHLESFSSIWVVHSTTNISHYDGVAWTTTDTGISLGVQFWVDDDNVYVAGETSLVRAGTDGTFDVIVSWDRGTSPPPPTIVGIDGSHSRHEVYLLLREPDFVNRECGAAIVLVYDGTSLRRF